jgi:cobalt-zinc-cadmium efflux system protein
MSAHSHHNHKPSSGTAPYRALITAVVLLFIFALVEAIGGWWANSLTLLSDAGHMLADGVSLILAAAAAWIATKPPSKKHSYGLGRAEVLGAWASSLFLVVIAIFIGIEAITRLQEPEHVSGGIVILIASIGVVVNLTLAWILHRSEQTLNTRAAILHLMGDLLGSVAALVSGVVIYFTHWTHIDAILSLFVATLILISSFRLLRETLLVLMEGVPIHIDIHDVENQMKNTDNVIDVQDLHVWTLSSGMIVLTAYVQIKTLSDWPNTCNLLQEMLLEDFSIQHITLQPETEPHKTCTLRQLKTISF